MAAGDSIGASPALKSRLAKLGLVRQGDLVLHLPLRYEDETQLVPVAEARGDGPVLVEVTVCDVSVQFRPRRQLVARVSDESGELTLRFLNFYGSQTKQLEKARDELNIEFGRLQLEQATVAESNRIDQVARLRLGMKFPEVGDVVVVRP